MPVRSRAQFRLMQAEKHGSNSKKERRRRGPSPEVAKEFLTATPKGAYAKLPEHVGDKRGK